MKFIFAFGSRNPLKTQKKKTKPSAVKRAAARVKLQTVQPPPKVVKK